MKFAKLLRMLNPEEDAHYDQAYTYRDDLERQSSFMFYPVTLTTTISWLPYISLDQKLFPNLPILVYFRLGLTFVALMAMALNLLPFFSKRKYNLVLFVFVYLELSTALILGLVGASPVYMGGFSLIVFLLPMIPIEREHAMVILGLSSIIFLSVGLTSGMKFEEWGEIYGGYNLAVSYIVSLVAIFALHRVRYRSYQHYVSVSRANEELHTASIELRTINEELEDAAIKLAGKNEELEQKRREEVIANQELQEANELKSKLLSMAAHDLRGPLQVILLHAGDLAEMNPENPDLFLLKRMTKGAQKISSNAEKMENLIKSTLENAVIDSGKLKLDKKMVDVAELAGLVVRHGIPLAEKKNQQIHFDSEEGCLVTGDHVRLEQVMDNLLRNAVKFSPPGTSIWVTVMSDGSTVTFKVKDQGPGLSDEDKKNLFKEFQRLSARPTGGETSTGLGLSISRQLVKLHDGDIRAESEQGKGCTFIVELPAQKMHIKTRKLSHERVS